MDANVKGEADASTAAAGPRTWQPPPPPRHPRRPRRCRHRRCSAGRAMAPGGGLWVAPHVVPDDWYFIYPTALAGPHARVLTNDEMRDHIWQLKLGKRLSFGRWKARHVVRFDFSHASSPLLPPPKLLLEPPPIYSREIQQGVRDEARATTAPMASAHGSCVMNNKSPTRQSTSANETMMQRARMEERRYTSRMSAGCASVTAFEGCIRQRGRALWVRTSGSYP